jgi:DNA topoisomerase-1
MHLLIVESPAKAKTINKFLGKDFKVISSFGHIRALPSENGAVDTDNDFAFTYKVLDKSKKHVSEIRKQIKEADSLYLATDPDREGEAISWHIYELLREKKDIKADFPVYRVTFHEITKSAIQQAVKHPEQINMDLVKAQQARQALDYLVGFTLSPVLWRKLPGSRSAGRVQSVALKVICEREDERDKFKSEEYWSITATCLSGVKKEFSAGLYALDDKKIGKMDIKNGEQAQEITARFQDRDFRINKVEKKQTQRRPSPPFTTSTMLQDASRKLGFSAKKTAMVAQKLYEGIEVEGQTQGLITYMRTDSIAISKEALEATREFIGKTYGDKYLPGKARHYANKTKNAQEAHEAIRPTNVELTPERIKSSLDSDQFKLYSLIWKRLMASQMENALIDTVTAFILSDDNKIELKATGSCVAFPGFLEVYNIDEDDDSKMLPALNEGDNIDIKEVLPKQHFTQPPARYNEASLVKKMEELGIGRPSTYPTIISILQDRKYVRLEKKQFIPENRGRLVTAFLEKFFTKYVEYDFTASLENELDEISNSKMDFKQVLRNFWKDFKHQIDETMKISPPDICKEIEKALDHLIFQGQDRKCGKCPDGMMQLRFSRFGPFLACTNYPECDHTAKIEQEDPDGNPDQSDSEETPEGEESKKDKAPAMEFPQMLGTDEATGREVSLRKGPYGIYVQLDSDDKKLVKRAGIPKGQAISKVDLKFALGLLALPRSLGTHPETGEEIKAGLGRYGPYIQYQKKFTSIKERDPLTITLEEALELLPKKEKE